MTIKEGKIRYNTPLNNGRSAAHKQMVCLETEDTPLIQYQPGYSFGFANRMDVKKWDFNEVKGWPKCSFTKPNTMVRSVRRN